MKHPVEMTGNSKCTVFGIICNICQYSCDILHVFWYRFFWITNTFSKTGAVDLQNIPQWPWVISGLDRKHWCFNVFVKMLCKHTIHLFFFILFYALWIWRVNLRVCEFHHINHQLFVNMSFAVYIFSVIENACVGKWINFSFFNSLGQIIGPCEYSQTTCW